MAWHLAVSENPIILSGEQILIKGKLDSSAIFAAKAVFPLWGGPGAKDKQGINEGENSSDNAQRGYSGTFRIPPRGICSVKWALSLLAEGTPGATQSSTWRQLMELLKHMQNDLPWHKRGHYTLCRSSHCTKMCEFVFWIHFLSLCPISEWALLVPWQTSQQQEHQGNTGKDNLLLAWIHTRIIQRPKTHLNPCTQHESVWRDRRNCWALTQNYSGLTPKLQTTSNSGNPSLTLGKEKGKR